MRYWLTSDDAPVDTGFIKRFDPRHWTIDFPRGAMGSVISGDDGESLTAHVSFLREGDLVGLIWDSEDHFSHPAHRREAKRDYSHCTLRFRWDSSGIIALDDVSGPTLTIEGEDEAGTSRSWYVRLWNYAKGTPTSAEITLDFDALNGGFLLPSETDRVNPKRIKRMFISLVPPGFRSGSTNYYPRPLEGQVTLSGIFADGSGSVLLLNDAMAPEHRLRMCTAYDDHYHLSPERVVDSIERLGFRHLINHYVGMSHYLALGSEGRLDASRPLNTPALKWHEAFARAAKARGYQIIWSLSFEILDQFCPEAWKQRASDGAPALTGYAPPSALISPANAEAVAYLGSVFLALARLSEEVGLPVHVQVGEPWWWVKADGAICLYDEAAKHAFGGDPVTISNARRDLSPGETALLDLAGAVLARATAALASTVKAAYPESKTYLLTYLPGSLDKAAPELRRANLPIGWSAPSFDVLQLEDYEWATEGRRTLRRQAVQAAGERLGYPPSSQHYLAGFVSHPKSRRQWDEVMLAAEDAWRRGVSEVFVWALPQVLRDGVTFFEGEEQVQAFEDVRFPIEIGAEASVAPEFSTAVVTSASGYEFRNANWSQARLRFDAGPGVRGDEELESLIRFFRARRGSAVAFRFQDPFDHSSAGMTGKPEASDQSLGISDGVQTLFPLVKRYEDGEVRRITRPVAGSLQVAVDGSPQVSGWTLDEFGVIAFEEPPAQGLEITAGFLFDVPVRFEEDRLEVNRASYRAGDVPSVPLIEVREG